MNSLVLLPLLLLAAASSASSSSFPDFDSWVQEHSKPWRVDTPEYRDRKALFEARLLEIVKHNADPHQSYRMGVNQFTASTRSELKGTNGAVVEMMKSHAPKNERTANYVMKGVADLPSSVDWRTQGVVSPVKNQGQCGSCWAFSTTESIESAVAIETGVLFSLSPQQIASCVDNVDNCGGVGGCSGGMPQVGFDSIAAAQGGITEEFQYPYESYYGSDFECKPLGAYPAPSAVASIEGYVQVAPNNYTELMNAVAQAGPVSIVLDASTFHNYAGGIFDGCDPENIELDHAVQLVGYGEEEGTKYWLVRNSWSPSWGENGYIRVKRTDQDDQVCDSTINGGRCDGDPWKTEACGTCGIMYSPSYPTGGKLGGGDHPDKP